MSNDEGYMKDYFSTYLNEDMRKHIQKENHEFYYEIENYKMSGYVTRVIETYQKRFEMCNEIARKNKPDTSKKNQPPVLVNLPVYTKYKLDENQYKNLLI